MSEKKYADMTPKERERFIGESWSQHRKCCGPEQADTLTIAYGMERNPDRRWWQVWKPRWVAMDQLQCFEVIHG